ncbi:MULTISPECIES: AAA family ATPase [unclassified Chryseobacterium]|uniref:AAA family ATPase n=1 Tax=unclassified Chryseobacterium TaxID=2593645 RepID=UPI0028530980|nr:AAA family ATPase [Chryseobacterium sp. CFS7]MDR4892687.1 AAA family ATPase [Chryseobacterium sp. CFS7]
MRKFYSCSVGEEGKGYDEKNLSKIIENKAFILHENTPQKGDYQNIKKNDILILKYRGQFVAYGEALDIKKSSDEEWNLFAPVEEWFFHDTLKPGIGPEIKGMKNATLGGSQYGTVKPLEEQFSLEKISKINDQTELYKLIQGEIQKQKEVSIMQDKIDLLEYKKQIILQGPPGTGKTRMAKMMAEEMAKVNKIESPIDLIDNYFKTYKPDESRLELRAKIKDSLGEFQEKFKKEELKNLPLENYALGTDGKDGFCYWLEYVLTETGQYNGQANKGKIYWKNDEQKYVKSGFLKDIEDDEEAMNKMAELLDDIINERHTNGIEYRIGKGFVLKVLNSYFPDKYFPINNEKPLTNVLKLIGEKTEELSYIQKNIRLQEIFLEKKTKFNSDITNNELMYFLFNNFSIKKEVKLENNELIVEGKYKIIQFHPAYSYEDFVRGISAKTNEKGDVNYKVENRILAEFAEEAFDNPKGKYILIVDEINRANLPSVLGELIYALEYRYNHEKDNKKEASVESLYDISENEEEPDRLILLPDNLYIIGTMNTADRSVGHIDYAIKRRFAFVDVPPTSDAIDNVVKDSAVNAKAKSLFSKVADLFNEDETKTVYLQSDFKAKEVQLGHSYFLAETEKQLEVKLEFEIIPLLNEYVKDGILSENALAEIQNL